jgi:hypothetical protein
MFLDIIDRPVFFYLKHNVSETGVLSSSSGKSLLNWVQSIELVPVSGPAFIWKRRQNPDSEKCFIKKKKEYG